MRQFIYLFIAVVAEVLGTSALKSSEGFSRLYPSIGVVVSYGCAFYFLSLCLRTLPLGVAYAIWSGVGIVLVSIVGRVVYKQVLDAPALVGIGLILSGVLVMNLLSKSTAH